MCRCLMGTKSFNLPPYLLRCSTVSSGFFQSALYPFLVSHCLGVLVSAGGRESQGERERVWSQRLPFKCEETVLCRISMHFLIFSSARFLLPVSPSATITCHPSRRLPLSLLSTLPLLFPLANPCLSPVILFIPFFLPFCRGPPPTHVHTSQVSARPYTPLPSLWGGCRGDR